MLPAVSSASANVGDHPVVVASQPWLLSTSSSSSSSGGSPISPMASRHGIPAGAPSSWSSQAMAAAASASPSTPSDGQAPPTQLRSSVAVTPRMAASPASPRTIPCPIPVGSRVVISASSHQNSTTPISDSHRSTPGNVMSCSSSRTPANADTSHASDCRPSSRGKNGAAAASTKGPSAYGTRLAAPMPRVSRRYHPMRGNRTRSSCAPMMMTSAVRSGSSQRRADGPGCSHQRVSKRPPLGGSPHHHGR